MPLLPLLLLALLPSALALWSWSDDPLSGPKEPNEDRITCLRQDNFDLIKPLEKKHALRMVIPVDDNDLKEDIYISLDNVQIKRVSMTINMKRTGPTSFAFDIFGQETCCDGKANDTAGIDFWINGLDLLIQNSWYDWGASFVADRKALMEGQSGTIRLKLHGEGQGVFNEETGMWEVEVKNKVTKPFEVHVEKQWLLEKVLKNYGDLDKIISDNLWKAINMMMPKSYAAVLTKLDDNDLWSEIEMHITGSQETLLSPLEVDVRFNTVLDTVPSQLLPALLEGFDAVTVAENYLKALLQEQDLQNLWDENKPMVVATLRRYGVKIDTLGLKDELNTTEIREKLIDAARKGADAFVKGLRPFMRAHKKGQTNPFDGFGTALQVSGGWDRSVDAGAISVLLSSPQGDDAVEEVGASQTRRLLDLPRPFLAAVGVGLGDFYKDLVVAPAIGEQDATIRHLGLSLTGSTMKLDRLQVQRLRLRTSSNGTDDAGEAKVTKQTWKIGGSIKDIVMKLPESWDPGWIMTFDESLISLSSSGDVAMALGNGVQLKQGPNASSGLPEFVAAKPRKGPTDTLDGVVPDDLARPTEPRPELKLRKMAPIVNVTAGVEVDGKDGRLRVVMSAEAKVSVNIGPILRPILAPRPVEDFGYTFYAGRFMRQTVVPSKDTVVEEAVALVSCGYLRVLQTSSLKGDESDPFKAANFDSKSRQLQVDLSLYGQVPDSETAGGQMKCVQVFSQGPTKTVKVSTGFFSSEYLPAQELLCGEPRKADQLLRAIEVQIQRFGADPGKTKAWNYGTHSRYSEEQGEEEVEEPQYLVPPGSQTVALTRLLATV